MLLLRTLGLAVLAIPLLWLWEPWAAFAACAASAYQRIEDNRWLVAQCDSDPRMERLALCSEARAYVAPTLVVIALACATPRPMAHIAYPVCGAAGVLLLFLLSLRYWRRAFRGTRPAHVAPDEVALDIVTPVSWRYTRQARKRLWAHYQAPPII